MEPDTASSAILYTYKTLPDGDFVRLMHLQPALHVDEPLRFTFTIDRIDNLIARYESISYTWGEPILDHALHIENACVMVTKNLDKALRRFRLPTTPRALWADAVCINQKDNQEKSRQIPLMTRLFRSASGVLAWLDGGDEETRGMQVLNALSRQSLPMLSDNEVDLQPSEWNAVVRFLRLSWFTRLWIIQEVVMNADMVLICHSSELSWLRFTIALSICAKPYRLKLASVDQGRLNGILRVVKLWEYHNVRKEKTIQPKSYGAVDSGILQLTNTFLAYGCADPRDRIFALYNVATDIQPATWRSDRRTTEEVITMDVNYSLDVRQVYQSFAAACIFSGKADGIFKAVLQRLGSESSDDWPSWVPDWRIPESTPWQYSYMNRPHLNFFSQAAFEFHGTPADVLSVSWRQYEGSCPMNIIDTILIIPSANDVPSMVSSLRARLAACPSSLVDILLQLLELVWPPGPYIKKDGTVVFGVRNRADSPSWMDSVAQQPSLFIANSSSPTKLLLGVASRDLLEGDEVALIAELEEKTLNTCVEHCLLVRKTSELADISGTQVMSHRLIGAARVARFRDLDEDLMDLYDPQVVTLYLR